MIPNKKKSSRNIHSARAQAALEFLMTYGWAVLVIIVVISGLAYFGVMNPKKQVSPAICLFSYGIACQDMHIGENSAEFFFTNSLGIDVIVYNITVGSCSNTFSQLFQNGESRSFTIAPCTFGAAGDLVSGKIDIYYNTTDGLEKFHQGSIKGVVE